MFDTEGSIFDKELSFEEYMNVCIPSLFCFCENEDTNASDKNNYRICINRNAIKNSRRSNEFPLFEREKSINSQCNGSTTANSEKP